MGTRKNATVSADALCLAFATFFTSDDAKALKEARKRAHSDSTARIAAATAAMIGSGSEPSDPASRGISFATRARASRRSPSFSAKIAAKISTLRYMYETFAIRPPGFHSFTAAAPSPPSRRFSSFKRPGIVPGLDRNSDVIRFSTDCVTDSARATFRSEYATPFRGKPSYSSASIFAPGTRDGSRRNATTRSRTSRKGWPGSLATAMRIAFSTAGLTFRANCVSASWVCDARTAEYGDRPANERSVTDSAWHADDVLKVSGRNGIVCSWIRSAMPPRRTKVSAHSSVGSMESIRRETFATASARKYPLTGGAFGAARVTCEVMSTVTATDEGSNGEAAVAAVAVAAAADVSARATASVSMGAAAASAPPPPAALAARSSHGAGCGGPGSIPPTSSRRRSTLMANRTPAGCRSGTCRRSSSMFPPIAPAVSPCMARWYAREVNAATSASSAPLFFTRAKPSGDRHSAPSALGRQHSASADGLGPGSSPSHASRNVCGTSCFSSSG